MKKGNPTGITTYERLGKDKKVRIGAPGGGTEERLALENGVPRDRVIVVPDGQSGINMLEDGRIDIYALPYSVAVEPSEEGRQKCRIWKSSRRSRIRRSICAGVAFNPKDTALRDAYNKMLELEDEEVRRVRQDRRSRGASRRSGGDGDDAEELCAEKSNKGRAFPPLTAKETSEPDEGWRRVAKSACPSTA